MLLNFVLPVAGVRQPVDMPPRLLDTPLTDPPACTLRVALVICTSSASDKASPARPRST